MYVSNMLFERIHMLLSKFSFSKIVDQNLLFFHLVLSYNVKTSNNLQHYFSSLKREQLPGYRSM